MMDSPCSSYHAKHHVWIYFILIAVATGTLFIYVNAVSQFDKLRLRIDDLEKQLSINIGESGCKNVSLVCKKGERGPQVQRDLAVSKETVGAREIEVLQVKRGKEVHLVRLGKRDKREIVDSLELYLKSHTF